jgi:protein-tyrosine phosphatase
MIPMDQMKKRVKEILKSSFWAFNGATLRNPPIPSKVQSILFICKGNICRSPFAEHIAGKQLHYANSCNISSAGIIVDEPETSPTEAVLSAENFGIDLRQHRSKPVSYVLMESYDMIVTMETWQHKHMKKLFLEFSDKIYLLPLFDCDTAYPVNFYNKYNIQDPYGKNILEFNRSFERIERCTTILLRKIGLIPET